MADAMFDPVAGLIDPKTYDNISQQWSTFLDDPKGRAALLQSGIALSQPLAWGQSNFGGLMSAIGSGGEAVGRVEAMDIKQQESDTKAQLREAQAAAAGQRAELSGSKAELAQRALDVKTQGMQLKAWNDLRKGYETYRKNVEAENANILRTAPPTPVMPIEQWIQTQPSAKAAAEASGLFGTTGTTAPGTFANPVEPSTTASPSSGAVPEAPQNPSDRKAGTIYNTPKGPLRWTGQGWTR